MKNRLLIIFGILTIFSISVFFTTEPAYAICIPSFDWDDRPCYGCPTCYPGLEQEKLDWEPYYDFKGAEWMEEKKQQLKNIIQNNSVDLWYQQTDGDANYNTHKYYFLQGEVPNRYGYNFEETLEFENVWNAVESSSKYAPILLWNYHDVILEGNIIETDLAQMISGEDAPLHTIKVNKYFKGEKNAAIITAVDNFDDLEINSFENGLFYLKKIENQNFYTVTIASVPTFANCDARDLIEMSPVLPNEKSPRSTPVGPKFIDQCVPYYFEIDPDDLPFFYESPLKQLKSGVAIQDIKCNEGKFLIHKRITLSPACVGDKASNDLVFPPYGWAKMRIGAPAETITQQKMCLWHPDVKLVQQNCSGFDVIEFEKYYLMNCVELAKDTIDETTGFSNNDIRNYVSDRLTTCTIQEDDEVNSDSCDQLYKRFTKGGPYLYERFKNLAENKLRNCVDYKDLNDYEMRSPGFILHENLLYGVSESELQLRTAKKLLQTAYYENINVGPLKINDAIVGFGIENDTLIIDVRYRYSTSSEMDIVKQKIRNIVGDEIKIEYIPSKESRIISKVMVYHWNEYLHKNNIEFAPAYPSHGNNDDGIGDGTFLCSPLVTPNGTEFYIVSTVIVEPFLITDTFIDIEKPEFCRKTWKTDVILEEPNRVISLWLEMGQGRITTE